MLLALIGASALAQNTAPAPAAGSAAASSAAAPTATKTLIDYFQPTPISASGLSKDVWGAPGVLPRDPKNGLEDPTVKQFNYWDGKIIKGPDGKYHIFASRWDAAKGHNGGWGGSVAVQAVSDNLYGPYVEKGLLWPDNQGGKGHNVTALVMPDGSYAVVVSETRPGDVFTSKSLDGPWVQLGTIKVDQPNWRASNYSMIVREDGDFEIVPRSGQILISKAKDGILGPYKVMGASVYPKTDADGTPLRNLEDPVVWYSGGLYHITVNNWSSRKAYHLVSKDGITNWKFEGLAYDPTKDFVRYTDGTVNHWNNMERPGVYIENGHVVAFTFAVIDVPKNSDRTNDGHGSKVIVIPFDGVAFDRDLQSVALAADAPATPVMGAAAAVPTSSAASASPTASAPPAASGARGGRRGGGGPRAPAPIPDNLDPESLAAENSAKAGPVIWPKAPEPAAPVYSAAVDSTKHLDWAQTPPMGWNSWDCFGAGIWQEDVFANAEYMEKNLKSHGWNLITIDIQWYEPLAHTGAYREGAWLMTDANGRLHPAPNRFPLTKDTGSFKPMADYLHAKGLKFGLHLMRGIPRQAVDRDNAPILGTNYHAQDIADKQNVCGWNHDMYGVDMSKPGAQEYYNSVFKQMADWGLDFVKVDDLSGHPAEIEAIRKAIDQCGRPIVFSISPGGASNANVAANANMWRISGDFWDNWPALYGQFNLLNLGTPFRAPGHWPDADMIPFGNLNTFNATFTWTKFTHDEQVTLMTLWSIARSPLILGANLPKNDDATMALITNDEVLAVDQNSTNNHQAYNQGNHIVWVADAPDSKDKYVAVFNANPAPVGGDRRGGRGAPPAASAPAPTAAETAAAAQPAAIFLALTDIGLNGSYAVRDLWTHQDLGAIQDTLSATVNSHGAVLYRLTLKN